MQLYFLGSGGYQPSLRRHTACLMIPEMGLVLDAGTGAFRIADLVKTEELTVIVSHAHLDHVAGLTFLLGACGPDADDRVSIHAHPEVIAAVREHVFAEPIFPIVPAFRLLELDGPLKLPAGGTLTHIPLRHPGGSMGMRLEWPGHSMAYITDTTAHAGADYVEFIRGVDLLVHEAYFNEDGRAMAELTGHSCVEDVATVAAEAGVRRMVLVHVDPKANPDDPLDLRVARERFPSLSVGYDGMVVEF
ncbi:Ribonuclease Z [Pirellulimonas nuda]|uniref:Ribonuclease Z n=1 Tax=Pirellulimonas nuda TaxID=2528009 RepID=A0A518D643_9BACT|nr:MBL fold metallo-hydrolase [Pirellulimonas nuda]QDU86937.1 Ribonuclease Z [Pirellulimonas nuda]